MIVRTLLLSIGIGLLGLSACAQESGPEDETVAAEMQAAELELAKTDAENWREVDPENLLIFETTKGRILIEALPAVAPKHVTQFKTIIRNLSFDGTVFHRVINGFMAQGGDIYALNGLGSGLPNIPGEFTFRRDPNEIPMTVIGGSDAGNEGYYLGFPMRTQSKYLAEISKDGRVDSWIPHCAGVVSTARTDDPNSANSQFFLMRGVAPHLDKGYTAWGRILDGQDTVDSIKTGEPVQNPDVLRTARIAADLSEETRPRVWVQRTDGPDFEQTLSSFGEASVCDLPPVKTVVEG